LDEAQAQARRTLEIDPRFFLAHYYLGGVRQAKGQLPEAISEFQQAFDLNGDSYSLAMLGQAYARAGNKAEAQKILARLNEEAKSRHVAPYALGLLYLGLGDKTVLSMNWRQRINEATRIIYSCSKSIHCSTICAVSRVSMRWCRRLQAEKN